MARYIDADALKIKYSERHFKGEITNEEYFNLIIPLDYAPTADVVERKKGEWKEMDGYDGDVYYECSACGNSWTTIDGTPWDNDMNFCPHCGADMRGEKKNDRA